MSGDAKKLLHKVQDAQPRSIREQRIDEWAKGLEQELTRVGRDFDLEQAVDHLLQVDPEAEEEVLEKTYLLALDHVWNDLRVTDDERESLAWIAQALELAPARVQHLNTRYGTMVFERFLAAAISDGLLQDEETQTLQQIADSMGTNVGNVMRLYFAKECERFLRGMFLTVTENGHLAEAEWQRLVATTESLGLGRDELLDIIQPQAEKFVEHVLADAKADAVLSPQEEKTFGWLMDHLKLPAEFHEYAAREVDRLRIITQVRQGNLPSISAPAPASDTEQVVHHHGPATYEKVSLRPSGPRRESVGGLISITNTQLLFVADGITINTMHWRVIEATTLRSGIELRTMDDDGIAYDFGDDHRLAVPIYLAALKQANPGAIAPAFEEVNPADAEVRQRVWLKYNGRCADCGSTRCLEFNYIIPLARGGSTAEANLCLVCQRCGQARSNAG